MLRSVIFLAIALAACSKEPVQPVITTTNTNTEQRVIVERLRAPLEQVSDTPANGIAEFVYNPVDETSQLVLRLNVEPKEGMYYQAWLKDSTTNEWLSAGILKSASNNARHTSSAVINKDARSFSTVVVTEQGVGTQSREAIIAQAEFNNGN